MIHAGWYDAAARGGQQDAFNGASAGGACLRQQHNSMGGKLVRTIGQTRVTTKIGMQNLAYKYQLLRRARTNGSASRIIPEIPIRR